jgi:hypothetical protein
VYGALLREGRAGVISDKQRVEAELVRQAREREKAELAPKIAEEEQKVRDLEMWVSKWVQARNIREFIAALELFWGQQGHDLSPESKKGQRIVWMKQQADRTDPMVENPPSILDRKAELRGW